MQSSERALQIWSVLAFAAHNRQVLTYSIVSALVGLPAQGMGDALEYIQQYCLKKGLPPLTALVVSKETGMPGSGFTAAEDVPMGQIQVFEYGWLTEKVPTPEELKAARA